MLIDVLSLYISHTCECVDYCLDISSYHCENSTSAIVNLKLQGDRVITILDSLITAINQKQKLHFHGSNYYISCLNLECGKPSVTDIAIRKTSQDNIIFGTTTAMGVIILIISIIILIVCIIKVKKKPKYPYPEH